MVKKANWPVIIFFAVTTLGALGRGAGESRNEREEAIVKRPVARIIGALLLMMTVTGTSQAAIEHLSLPEGDAERGREAFVALKCTACHEVREDITMQKLAAGLPGPKLGVGQSRYKADFLADSIVSPSHAIVPGFGAKEPSPAPGGKGVSRMGDFSDTLTVRQLADIIAYLKQLDEEV